MSAIDLAYRPTSYFWPLSLATHLLSTVKGAARQRHIRTLIEENRLAELDDWIATESLSEEMRQAVGRIHPMFMGGEYLPGQRRNEVEIARISLQSVTGDVYSIRATRRKSDIGYRIVDEYSGSSFDGPTTRRSARPLTLGQLEDFIEHSGGGLAVVRWNISEGGGPAEHYANFLTASSPFYPHLGELYRQRFAEMVKREFSDHEDDCDSSVDSLNAMEQMR